MRGDTPEDLGGLGRRDQAVLDRTCHTTSGGDLPSLTVTIVQTGGPPCPVLTAWKSNAFLREHSPPSGCIDAMTAPGPGDAPLSGPFWFTRRIWPYIRIAILGMLPCPDLAARHRMRRDARDLITLRTWPGMDATSAQAAQLAMLRLLWLQKQTRRAVRWRQREAAVMLARACVETMFLGLYCLREPAAVSQLQASNLKAAADAFAYFEDAGIVPAEVIRQCIARLGEPGRRHVRVWDMVKVVDEANGNNSAREIYRRLYVPLSNFTVHANGGTLLRHVGRGDKLTDRPARTWNRRSPVRVADAATGLMAAAIASECRLPHASLIAYADRHSQRAFMPVAFMGLSNIRGAASSGGIVRALLRAREMYDYLWHGAAALDPLETRTAYVARAFAEMLDIGSIDVREGSLDPFIDYVADMLSRLVHEAGGGAQQGEPGEGPN